MNQTAQGKLLHHAALLGNLRPEKLERLAANRSSRSAMIFKLSDLRVNEEFVDAAEGDLPQNVI